MQEQRTTLMSGLVEMEMVIGLEVHCQLGTRSKLFCPCSARGSEAPANSCICPVCTGQPGCLPVLNQAAVESAFKAALALGCGLQETSTFARKNYFYPDLPKGYQISQFEEPFAKGGGLDIPGPPPRNIRIHRIHIEEDAGKLVHAVGARRLEYSLVDYNRAGIALIEIVSEPELRSPGEAHQYLTALKSVLQYVEVSRCDMEKGEMRCDANISVRPKGGEGLGTKIEIKNLNSFRAVQDALEYEFQRQCDILGEGGSVAQETRLWDSKRGATESMRSKEESHDYRYFPEPDLAPLRADPESIERLRAGLPELPAARRARWREQYRITDYDAGVLTADKALADYYEACVKACRGLAAKTAAHWITTDLLGKLNAEKLSVSDVPVSPEDMGGLVVLIEKGALSSKLAKEVFSRMWETRQPADALIRSLGLSLVSDQGQLSSWVEAAMAENPKAVEDLRNGKERAISAIIGSVMKKSGGRADPSAVHRLIQEKLS